MAQGHRPLLFLGSSGEYASINPSPIDVIRQELHSVATVHPWNTSPIFQNMRGTFPSLLEATRHYGFGLFVLTPDDLTESRGTLQLSSRDNVLFELGMFLGALGQDKVFAIAEENRDGTGLIKVPSDLFGVHIDRFSMGDLDHMTDSIGNALVRIKRQINESMQGFQISLRDKEKGYKFDPETGTAVVNIDTKTVRDNMNKIGNRSLLLVVRKRNEGPAHLDKSIAIGAVRELDPKGEDEIIIRASRQAVFDDVKGASLDFTIFLIPKEVDVTKCETIQDLRNKGGVEVERFGMRFD
jgi:hypothetical protein